MVATSCTVTSSPSAGTHCASLGGWDRPSPSLTTGRCRLPRDGAGAPPPTKAGPCGRRSRLQPRPRELAGCSFRYPSGPTLGGASVGRRFIFPSDTPGRWSLSRCQRGACSQSGERQAAYYRCLATRLLFGASFVAVAVLDAGFWSKETHARHGICGWRLRWWSSKSERLGFRG